MTGEPIKYEPTLDLRPLAKEKPPMDHNDPTNSAVKPAYKTTEFWLTFAAQAIGITLASGILSPADPSQAKLLQLLGLAASVLSALGYTAMRTSAKNTVAEGATAIALEKLRVEAAPAAIALLKNAGVVVPTPPASS